MGDVVTKDQKAWEAELECVFDAAPDNDLDFTAVAGHVLAHADVWSARLGIAPPTAVEVPAFTDIQDLDIAELVGAGIASYVRTLNGGE